MSWTLLLGLVGALGVALFAALSRRAELARMRRSVATRETADRHGAEAKLQHPVIDLSRCLGCATCVAVCPEDGVLEIVHGQAMVVNPTVCVGVSACERECPVGAVTVTLSNLETRNDIPAVEENLEAVGAPGLFLAGEVTAHALIKTAIEHGTEVAAEVARRTHDSPGDPDVFDLCIVGAGPAGLACSLEAKRLGLSFVTLDQESGVGGTVAKYPRRKLVMTQPVELPLYGRLKQLTYSKEELMDLWQDVVDTHALPIRQGQVFEGVERDERGHFHVHTDKSVFEARHVCLALGRRGTPRRLGVPGEELPKVAYSLLDAQSYRERRILVVGGGDTAVETAVGLAEQPGNAVTLSYRKDGFFRVRSKNEQRLDAAVADGRVELLFGSEVEEIRDGAVDLTLRNGHGPEPVTLPNDDVFVMAGGTPPIDVLQRAGVSFDPSLRAPAAPITEQGTGLTRALIFGFVLSLAALLWALWHSDYYLLPGAERPIHDKHPWLRPGLGIGLWLGIAAAAMIVVNLLYLLRRAPRIPVNFGSLRAWMTSHVATGILALLCATLHAAMSPAATVGGRAYWALAVLLVTGAIGRYFYAYVPRAANGRELELMEVKAQMEQIAEEWDHGQRMFRERVRSEVFALIEARQWKGWFVGRVFALFGGQRDLRRVLGELEQIGRDEQIPEAQIRETLWLARRAHRTALMAAHYEDLRAVLGSWRYLHRWVAALMVVLVVVHIINALAYGAL